MMKLVLIAGTLLLAAAVLGAGDEPLLGDYDAELRMAADRFHVDCELMVRRLEELHANTYMWLMWHSANDWEDLHEFLPLAQEAGITVWAYLVPHSESGGKWPYSEPFKVDYVRWAQEIARLSLEHENLVGYVIDDFWGNFDMADRFSVEYTTEMVAAGKAINPKLKFYPLMYYRQFGLDFVEKLAPIVDGCVAAYPRDRAEIESALTFLNDEYILPPRATVVFPPAVRSAPGDRGFLMQTARVHNAGEAAVSFHYRDSYNGPTEGYHVMQLRVDDKVIWEEDAGGRDDADVRVDLSEAAAGKQQIRLAIGVFDKQGVGHYGLRAQFTDLQIHGLEMADADISNTEAWEQEIVGDFSVEFAARRTGEDKFNLPLIVMPAGSRGEYEHRWGHEATASLIAAKVRMILGLVAEGKVEGIVTYCLNKQERSEEFDAVAAAYEEFRAAWQKK
jgi:hypothetical protein